MIQSVKKALDLLDLLIFEDPLREGLMLGDLAKRLGLPVATAHHVLKTLCLTSYAEQLDSGRYAVGSRIAEINRLNRIISQATSRVIKEQMEALCADLHEGIVFATLFHGRRLSLWQIQPDRMITINTAAMENQRPFSLPTGRVLAAFASPAERDLMLTRYGLPSASDWPGCTTRSSLTLALERIKQQGYEIITQNDICAFAVPIMERDGSMLGALGCFAPAFRCPPAQHHPIVTRLINAAEHVNTAG